MTISVPTEKGEPMAELKPCPFCGCAPYIQTHSFWNDKTKDFTDKTFGVLCGKCQTSGGQFYPTEEAAIEAWNKRTEPERPKGRWVKDGDFMICLNCESEINVKNSLGIENRKNFCPNCGADMRGESE